jgi:hypothetical protein
MLKDIEHPVSEGVTISAIYEMGNNEEMVWNIYLLNYKNSTIEGVLITSKGYGQQGEEIIKTSTLRHFVPEIAPQMAARIEPLQEDVFELTNEYFVTYYVGNTLYERKFVFEPYAINLKNTVHITFMGQFGIEVV